MARMRVSLEELLLRHRSIDEEHLRAAKDHQKKSGGELGRVLVELGYLSEELLLRAQAHQLGIPLVNLEQSPPPRVLAIALSEVLCRRFNVVPVSGNLESKLLRVATSSPGNLERLAMLADASGFRIEAAAATADSIEHAIRAAFSGAAPDDEDSAHPELHPEPDELGELRERITRMEKMLSNPPFAALLSRLERLEQIAQSDHHALNVMAQVLLDMGFITREELKKRLGRA